MTPHVWPATLEEIRQSNGTLSTRHRTIDVQGRVHDVLVISERLQDRGAAVIGTHGYYVDATPSDEARDAQVSAVVAEIAEHRAAIEQTKGMLMLIYRIPADTAFELLKWRLPPVQPPAGRSGFLRSKYLV